YSKLQREKARGLIKKNSEYVLYEDDVAISEEILAHWLSLAERWKSIRKDPAWEDILKKFPAEKEELEKLFADEKNYPANSGKFYETLSRIESYASKQEVRERKRIWKRLFGE
ncbi:MAG: hypothetical protein IKA79_01900, partial [Lentisphaeria bacterium]|nr:hypothetical protein [Lentisphaeria bacterium]